MEGEEPFDAVDLARALARQREELAVQVSPVLVLDTRHVHHAPHAALARVVAEQEPHERGRVEAVGLGATRAAVLGDARRVDDMTRDTAVAQRPMEPEAARPRSNSRPAR